MKKILSKLNKLDILVIVLSLLILIFLIYRNFFVIVDEKNQIKEINIYAETTSIQEEDTDKIKSGDKIYAFPSNICVGEIIDVKAEDALQVFNNPDGSISEPLKVEGFKKLKLIIKAEGNYTDMKIVLKDKYELLLNSSTEMNTSDMYLKVIPLTIEER